MPSLENPKGCPRNLTVNKQLCDAYLKCPVRNLCGIYKMNETHCMSFSISICFGFIIPDKQMLCCMTSNS